jgi:serine protease inhibitor
LDVNEKGSEASAATVVKVVRRSLEIIVDIELNRPFIYFISKDDTILFIGTFNGEGTQTSTPTKTQKEEL